LPLHAVEEAGVAGNVMTDELNTLTWCAYQHPRNNNASICDLISRMEQALTLFLVKRSCQLPPEV
jgi:hypothetical protein